MNSLSFIPIARALGGGALMGLAASLALVGHGRITGISGTIGRALDRDGGSTFRVAFLAGLIGLGLIANMLGCAPAIGAATHGLPLLALAGLLVGVGTTVGNGCTTGLGICGISRGSMRAFVGVNVFMVVAAITVRIAGVHS